MAKNAIFCSNVRHFGPQNSKNQKKKKSAHYNVGYNPKVHFHQIWGQSGHFGETR